MKKRITSATIVLAALLLVICTAIMEQWRCRPIHQMMNVTKEEFLQKMEKLDERYQSTIFSENGELLFEIAQDKQYDEYLVPALFCKETMAGRFTKGEFNYWNGLERLEIPKTKPGKGFEMRFANFETPDQSIEVLFETIEQYYKECKTYEDFANRWAPNTAAHPHQAKKFGKDLYQLAKQIENL